MPNKEWDSLQMGKGEGNSGGRSDLAIPLGFPLGGRDGRGVERSRGAEVASQALAPRRGGLHRSSPRRRRTNLRFPSAEEGEMAISGGVLFRLLGFASPAGNFRQRRHLFFPVPLAGGAFFFFGSTTHAPGKSPHNPHKLQVWGANHP
jgi:hypothetical protein